jgi:hypothetical protein
LKWSANLVNSITDRDCVKAMNQLTHLKIRQKSLQMAITF